MTANKNPPSMRILEKLSKLKISEVVLGKLERLAAKMGIDEDQLFHLYLEVKNNAYSEKFARIPFSDRVLFLPQCLRAEKCHAKLNRSGYECLECGKCDVKKIIGLAKHYGYKKVYIVSGGSMTQKLLSLEKPKACLGIACVKELILGSFVCEKFGIIPQGISLLRDGCVDTCVDWKSMSTVLRSRA